MDSYLATDRVVLTIHRGGWPVAQATVREYGDGAIIETVMATEQGAIFRLLSEAAEVARDRKYKTLTFHVPRTEKARTLVRLAQSLGFQKYESDEHFDYWVAYL